METPHVKIQDIPTARNPFSRMSNVCLPINTGVGPQMNKNAFSGGGVCLLRDSLLSGGWRRVCLLKEGLQGGGKPLLHAHTPPCEQKDRNV